MRLRIRLLLIGLLLAALAASHWAVWEAGHASAEGAEKVACQQVQIEGLSESLQKMQRLTEQASNASLQLGKMISARQRADAITTQEIRHALQATATTRVECVFDDGVMRLLTAARERANQAAAGGIAGSVSGHSAADRQ